MIGCLEASGSAGCLAESRCSGDASVSWGLALCEERALASGALWSSSSAHAERAAGAAPVN